MAINITKGKQNTPIKAVVYGPEGIGKSTFASKWPQPLFIDAEGGTTRLDVDRTTASSWSMVNGIVDELTANNNGYKTLVLDTADWLEKMTIEAVCQNNGQKSIESFGYGKGFTHLAEEWKRFLDKLTRMQASNGMHVVFLGHATMRKFEQPDEQGAYDRWELKLLKQSPGMLKEWADMVLFLNYKTIVAEIDGKHKASGGKRVMFTQHHPCWDAKNRFDLKAEMELDFKAIAHLFTQEAPKAEPKPEQPKPAEKPAEPVMLPPKVPLAPATAMDAIPMGDEQAPLLAKLADLMKQAGVTDEEVRTQLAKRGIQPLNMPLANTNVATLNRVIGGWQAVSKNIIMGRGTK